MRGLYILVLLALVLPTAQPGPSSTSLGLDTSVIYGSSANPVGLLISEVCPGKPVQYVILTNYGSERDLSGMYIDDGEGNISFLERRYLGYGSSLAVVEDGDTFASLRPGVPFVEKGDASIKWSGRFAIADGGDEAILRAPDRSSIDVVAFGSSLYAGEGWSGPVLPSVSRGHAALRCGGDTNTSSDWAIEPPGRTEHPQVSFDAVVEPFSAPETAAGRIVRELSMASRTVNCSVYEISDPFVVWHLARCASRGLDVNVLIEGQPVGGLSQGSKDASATLAAAGADVRELRSLDSYKRYDYVHSKYMVVDGRRVTVMSENWGSGLYANRGWGVTMDGVNIGAYYDRVFDGDFNGQLDVTRPKGEGTIIDGADRTSAPDELVRYRCQVSPVISPDNAARLMEGSIDGALSTVLVEQLSIEPEWLEGSSLLASLIRAAERGVKVRVLLDSSWDRQDNQMVADRLNGIAAAKGYDLQAKVISPYHGLSVMHNKGIIADNLSIVSSINWGNSALYENREIGAAVRSDQVAAYFSTLFWKDWSLDPEPPVPCLPWTYIEVPEGRPVMLDASTSTDNAHALEFEWDVDGDGTVESNASSWAVKLPPGNHTVVLTLRDRGNNTVSAHCWISVRPNAGAAPSAQLAAMLALPPVVIALVIIWKRISHGKNV